MLNEHPFPATHHSPLSHPPHELILSTEVPKLPSDAERLLAGLWRTSDQHHFVAVQDRSTQQFSSHASSSIAEAAASSLSASKEGLDAFVACAEYKTENGRTASNASGACAFWLDIDCSPEKAASGKGYADTDSAHAALTRFCHDLGLKPPTHVISSGGGLHVYWCLNKHMASAEWRRHATQLKALASHLDFRADPARTADIASVLRVPGTLNQKYTPARPVSLLQATDPIDAAGFLEALERTHATHFPPVSAPAKRNAAGPASAMQSTEMADLREALSVLDPDCDESTWKLRRLAPMAGAAREYPERATELRELARSWSSGDLTGRRSIAWQYPSSNGGRAGREVFDETWERFLASDYQGAPITLATIFQDASTSRLQLRGNSSSRNVKPPAGDTHNAYAVDLLARLTVGEHKPTTHEGTMYRASLDTGVWLPVSHDELVRKVSESYDGLKNCTRRSDYEAIAAHACRLVDSDSFFAAAPVGVACVGKFYWLDGSQILDTPLTPHHRQRVVLPFAPRSEPTPLFASFLRETFKSPDAGEEAEQVQLLQEIAGAILLGLMSRYQKAVLFYDPYGRAGKGTMERILRCLVPPEFVKAISPFSWQKEYYAAMLVGARLNVVGELEDGAPLPSASFKTVLGGDLITGRNPSGRPISFRCGAAHLFMSNHLINSRDQSEAFFARWLIIEFPNSRLRTGQPLDPLLADRIIERELPGIAHWALEGAARLMGADRFSHSSVHERLMAKWRRGNSSLEEFIFESCELGSMHLERRASFYEAYRVWCAENGRKPYSKSNVKELLENNLSLAIRHSILDGNEVFRGVRLKPDVSAEIAFLGL